MEIINMDVKTFEAMLSKFENFARRMEVLCHHYRKKDLSGWIDSQDVCLLLNISPRMLQTLRNNGTLPFSRISRRIYYKSSDVEKMVQVVEENQEQVNYKRK